MEKVLLFFSGGNDSTLAACKLALQSYDVKLITFDNGCEEGLENIRNRATVLERIFEKSSYGKIHNLGVFSSMPEFKALRQLSVNVPFSSIVLKYGDLNMNQINCLTCRSAMYVIGVVVAKELGIKYIAEGARKSQMFALEQTELLEKYELLLSKYNMDLLLPVFDVGSDIDVSNELWSYSPKFFEKIYKDTIHYEASCLLGCPMDRALSKEEINSYALFLMNF